MWRGSNESSDGSENGSANQSNIPASLNAGISRMAPYSKSNAAPQGSGEHCELLSEIQILTISSLSTISANSKLILLGNSTASLSPLERGKIHIQITLIALRSSKFFHAGLISLLALGMWIWKDSKQQLLLKSPHRGHYSEPHRALLNPLK